MKNSDFVADPGYPSELSNSLFQLQQSGHLCDTLIKTKSGILNAHKIVLFANGGPFLQEQISRNVSLDTSMCNIDLSHVLHEDVLALVTYLYTGRLKVSCIQSESCLKLFQFLEIDLEKLKGNSTAVTKKNGGTEHIDAGQDIENENKSVDNDNKIIFDGPSYTITQNSTNSDNDNSDLETFEIEISNMEEEREVTDGDEGDGLGQGQILNEKTEDFMKHKNMKIESPSSRRKKIMVSPAERRKRKSVQSENNRKKETLQLEEKRRKGTFQSAKKQKKEILESAERPEAVLVGTICSVCSLDVQECLCEVTTNIDVTCTNCQIRYPSKEDLMKHREEKHSLRCGMCDFKITKGSNLVSHLLEKHGISSSQLETGYLLKQDETADQQTDYEHLVSSESNEIPDSIDTNEIPVSKETATCTTKEKAFIDLTRLECRNIRFTDNEELKAATRPVKETPNIDLLVQHHETEVNYYDHTTPIPNCRGRPQLDIDIGKLQQLLLAGFTVKQIALDGLLGGVLHPNTLYNKLKEHNMKIRSFYSNMTDEDLQKLVVEYKKDHPNAGAVKVKAYLKTIGHQVQRQRCRDILEKINSAETSSRRSLSIQHQQYNVP